MSMNDRPDPRIRMLQVLIGAMTVGLIMFGAIVSYLLRSGQYTPTLAARAETLAWCVGGLFVFTGVANVLLCFVFRRKSRGLRAGLDPTERADAAFSLLQTSLILRAALLEGPGLFAVTATLLTGYWWNLAWAGCAIAGFFALFPTQGSLTQFIDESDSTP